VLYTFRDITEQKRAQLAAETADRTKDELLNQVASELQKPLAPILEMAGALEQDATLSPEARAKVDAIRRSAEAEAQLIADLRERVRTPMERAEEEVTSPRP
jgi:signal transduction histidine kinase